MYYGNTSENLIRPVSVSIQSKIKFKVCQHLTESLNPETIPAYTMRLHKLILFRSTLFNQRRTTHHKSVCYTFIAVGEAIGSMSLLPSKIMIDPEDNATRPADQMTQLGPLAYEVVFNQWYSVLYTYLKTTIY